MVNRLWDDADLAHRFANMYAGPDFPSRSSTTPATTGSSHDYNLHPRCSASDIDVRRALSAVLYNSFEPGSYWTSGEGNSEKWKDLRQSNRPAALYELPSFINHSCIASAHRLFFNDVLIVRADSAMKAGDEVTIAYFSQSENDEDPVNGIKSQRVWGFLCSCKLCAAKRIDGPEVVEKCKALIKGVAEASQRMVDKATSTLSQLEAIYGQPHWKDVPCKGILASAYAAMAFTLDASGCYQHDAIEFLIKSMESDGVFVSLARDEGSKSDKQTKYPPDITISLKSAPSCGHINHVSHIFSVGLPFSFVRIPDGVLSRAVLLLLWFPFGRFAAC